ncbi:hypothetical protein GS416_03530 [Rhodococcus hoagii]|nr:hypothetical protein [Prescottella equi]
MKGLAKAPGAKAPGGKGLQMKGAAKAPGAKAEAAAPAEAAPAAEAPATPTAKPGGLGMKGGAKAPGGKGLQMKAPPRLPREGTCGSASPPRRGTRRRSTGCTAAPAAKPGGLAMRAEPRHPAARACR